MKRSTKELFKTPHWERAKDEIKVNLGFKSGAPSWEGTSAPPSLKTPMVMTIEEYSKAVRIDPAMITGEVGTMTGWRTATSKDKVEVREAPVVMGIDPAYGKDDSRYLDPSRMAGYYDPGAGTKEVIKRLLKCPGLEVGSILGCMRPELASWAESYIKEQLFEKQKELAREAQAREERTIIAISEAEIRFK